MWKLVSFVRRGRLRTAILDALVIPNNPTDLAKKLNSHRPTVSQAIGELKEKGLVKRLNPNEKNISIYGLTKEGNAVLEKIKKMKAQ
jgi:DNA-binding MarR family transcriptional regulator